MRRGGFGKESSDQPHKEVPVTPVMKVLHPITRIVVGVGFFAGGTLSLFTWDWRYFVASWGLALSALIVGPWRWPHEQVRIEPDPRFRLELPGVELDNDDDNLEDWGKS